MVTLVPLACCTLSLLHTLTATASAVGCLDNEPDTKMLTP